MYPTARIGVDGSIGTFCEIGENVVIGDRVRIGAFCFIPEGVMIEDDAWIGPRVTFTNDRYPPSPTKAGWSTILVCSGAVIGACACILPGVIIGKNAHVAAGSLVVKDVAPNTLVMGSPARFVSNIGVKNKWTTRERERNGK